MKNIKHTKRCVICLLSESFPDSGLDSDNTCKYCRDFKLDKDKETINLNQNRIHDILTTTRGENNYDVIVAYSGGKDSTFTLKLLKENYNLRICAMLIDNNFVSRQAFINARSVVDFLGIDLIINRPSSKFMHNLYNKSIEGNMYSKDQLKRANAACLSCIGIINSIVLNESVSKKIPLIAGGYIGGQIPEKSGMLKISPNLFRESRKRQIEKLKNSVGKEAESYMNVESSNFHPIIINPLLGLNYDEKYIIQEISKIGWILPNDTGKSSSNCLLNDYAISKHYLRYKYHPYEAEICLQVRRGMLSKKAAMLKLNDIKDLEQFKHIDVKLSEI